MSENVSIDPKAAEYVARLNRISLRLFDGEPKSDEALDIIEAVLSGKYRKSGAGNLYFVHLDEKPRTFGDMMLNPRGTTPNPPPPTSVESQ